MTFNQFAAECHIRTLHPALVIENDKIKKALKDRNDELVLKLLNTEF